MGTWVGAMANVTYFFLLALPPAVKEHKCFFDVEMRNGNEMGPISYG
jgi:hypothetical protein